MHRGVSLHTGGCVCTGGVPQLPTSVLRQAKMYLEEFESKNFSPAALLELRTATFRSTPCAQGLRQFKVIRVTSTPMCMFTLPPVRVISDQRDIDPPVQVQSVQCDFDTPRVHDQCCQ